MEVDIGGKLYKCHLDTGRDHSIKPQKLIPSAEIHPTSVRVTAANGTDITILGQVRLRFLIQQLQMSADLLVAEDVEDLILGYNWLRLQG